MASYKIQSAPSFTGPEMHFQRLARLIPALLPICAAAALAQNPIGQLVGADASVKGSVVLAGGDTRVLSGSTIAAGFSNATVKLERGGELRVCKGSSVSLTSSANGQEIMIGLSSGTLETHYAPTAPGDSLMTPDFQMQLLAPGNFHFAISADIHGNTCVQSLAGNSGSLRISELMADGAVEVKPGESLFFRLGKVYDVQPMAGNCGCLNEAPVMRTATGQPTNEPPAGPSLAEAPVVPSASPAPQNAAPMVSSEIHVEVDAPFVFRASELHPIPDPPYNMARIHLSGLPVLPAATALPPGARQQAAAGAKLQKRKKGFWGMLASIFS